MSRDARDYLLRCMQIPFGLLKLHIKKGFRVLTGAGGFFFICLIPTNSLCLHHSQCLAQKRKRKPFGCHCQLSMQRKKRYTKLHRIVMYMDQNAQEFHISWNFNPWGERKWTNSKSKYKEMDQLTFSLPFLINITIDSEYNSFTHNYFGLTLCCPKQTNAFQC